ncbi:MAG: 5'-nucleotidase C-terminal domain-containing protein [Gemmatimonadetes bacterium]|nr:5'-nucleotidase C-terminal domain-containing protein [Gemmatimonadota bacterium]
MVACRFPIVATALLIGATVACAQGGPVDLVDLRVVATTDVHGRIRGWDYFGDSAEGARGLARVATIVDSVRGAVPNGTILVDAGDFLQGNALAYVASRPDAGMPHPIVAAMNAMRYDAVAIGNHEFNYGLEVLDRTLSGATFAPLAANVRRLDGKPDWASTAWVERSGIKIAIIGVTTPWSMVWDRTLLLGKLEIYDIVESTRTAVAAARGAGAAVVVVVAHAGLSSGSGPEESIPGIPPESPMAEVARTVSGIDLIVFGHSHREVADSVINGVLMIQPRNWATSAAVAALRVERVAGAWRVTDKHGAIVRAAGHAEAPAIVALAEGGHGAAREYANATIGSTASAWSTDSSRTTDTPIIDFIGEVMRRATGADLASTAVFSVDVHMPAGPITVSKLAQLYPYDNTIRVLRLSGAQLRAYLEQSARYFRVSGAGAASRVAPDPAFIGFNFEVVTGADYAIDLSRAAGDRITGLTVRGRSVTPGDSFTIALTNYRASGTGGYGMLVGATVVKDDQREIRQLLIDEVVSRRELKAADYFTRSWRVVPAAMAAEAQRAIKREPSFEAVRRPPPNDAVPPVSGAPPPASRGAAATRGARASVIRVIATNDFHGALEARQDGNAGMRGGAAHFASVIRRIAAECTDSCASVLVDGGDVFQGTPASNLAFGRPIVALYNALGYAAAAIGNHDFDWGQDTLRARMREANYGMLAANVTYANGTAVPWIRPDTIVDRGGVRVGIIGLATVQTPSLTMASKVADLRFRRAAPVVIARARNLRARGADMVIVIAHASSSCNASVCDGEMADLAREAEGSVDAIVGGHSHTEFSAVIAGVPVIRSRSSGRGVAYVDVPVNRAARTALTPRFEFVDTDSVTPDPAIARLVAAALDRVQALVDRPVATVAETMRRRGPQYALGNLIADAQREAAQADIAVMNNGGIRVDLRAGPATYGAFYEIAPFGNLLMRISAPGAAIRAYFERAVGGQAVSIHVSGITIAYDPSRPHGNRIVDIKIAGVPLDDARDYTMAMSDFMATGGDGLALTGSAVRTTALGIVDVDALIAYAESRPGGIIRPDSTPRISPVR